MNKTASPRAGMKGFSMAVAAALASGAMVLLPAERAPAANVSNTWNDGNADWATAGNWSQGNVPGNNINNTDTAIIDNGSTVTVSTDVSGNKVRLNAVNVTAGTLEIATGGTLYVKDYGSINAGISGNNGTINVTGGTVRIATSSGVDGTVVLGSGLGAGNTVGTGTLNVSAGDFIPGNLLSEFPGAGTKGLIYAGSKSNGVINLSGTGAIYNGTYGQVRLGYATPDVNQPTAGTGTVNQTGGSFNNGRIFYIGSAAEGTYNISGGLLNTGYNSVSPLYVGYGAKGTLKQTGGTVNSGVVSVGTSTGDGLLEISGGIAQFGYGSASAGQPGGVIGSAGGTNSAVLRVIGSGATDITFHGHAGQNTLTSYQNATLNFQIGSSGITPITADAVSTTDGRDLARLSGKLDIDLLPGFTPTTGQQFVLLTTNSVASFYENGHNGDNNYLLGKGIVTGAVTYQANNANTPFTNAGLTLAAADVGVWTWSVDPTYNINNAINGYKLVATYVPEPASIVSLMGVGGLALLRRRRLRA